MTVTGTGGESGAQAIEAEVQKLGKRVTREGITIWNTTAQDRITSAAEMRTIDSPQGDSEGRQGRLANNLHELVQSFTAPVWDATEGVWRFAVTDETAQIHEFGAVPHEIRAKQARALAFEWPDAPEDIQEKFEATFPTVFFNSVQHPGAPAIGYMRHGREQARQRVGEAGFDASAFGVGGGDA